MQRSFHENTLQLPSFLMKSNGDTGKMQVQAKKIALTNIQLRTSVEDLRPLAYRLVRVVSTIILMAIMANMTHLSVAAVYECRDAVGKSVLTNRQQGLHSCRLVIKEVPTSAATKMAPKQPSATALPNQASHADEPSTVLPTYKDAPESAPPPHSSCRQGVNLLSPLIATPYPHPDPSSQPQPSMYDGEPGSSR
jgi:hypothetical protein